MHSIKEIADVVILGGGLAGMSLALQLKNSNPNLAIIVLERKKFPAPEAAHKVGESTVEIGSHYLSHTLGLKDMLEATQLRKFGLRFFLGAGSHDSLSGADELGASSFLPAVSYQLDRGRLENDLVRLLRDRGIDVIDGCMANNVVTEDQRSVKEVHWHTEDQSGICRSDWVVDATGRASLLKQSMKLQESSGHEMNSAWFRLDTELNVENWSTNPKWHQRCNGIPRQLSTNHLLGPGYWVWIIPLVGKRVSIGLVADPRSVPLDRFNDFDRFRAWSEKNQPLLAEHLEINAGELMDFRFLRNFSYGCKQTYSHNGWAVTGEAGLFPDPFYSPGTDFIAISNTLICGLILDGRDDPMKALRAAIYNKVYQSFFTSTMSLYRDQYAGFGDTRFMVLKATWDYAYYWSVLAWLFFREKLTEIEFLRRNEAQLNSARQLNLKMQAIFRERAALGIRSPGRGRFFDQLARPILLHLNTALLGKSSDDAQELSGNCDRLRRLAPLVKTLLDNDAPRDKGIESELLGDLRSRFA